MNTAGHTDVHGLDLIPFRGVRYDSERVGSLAAVTSPPYDVVVRPDGLLELESSDPHNIVRLILPQATTPEDRNRQAADTLHDWLAEGILAPDPIPGLYVYEQRGDGILQRGIIGALRLSEPADGIVLPHEDVMPHVVEDRAALMRATAANLEPLLLTYPGGASTGGAAAAIERATHHKPLLSTTTEDGFSHRLWAVTDPAEIAEIQSDLAHHQALIADGHHRWATNLRLRAEHASPSPWDFGLVLLVDTARYPLRVRAIHRYLHRLPVAEALAAQRATLVAKRKLVAGMKRQQEALVEKIAGVRGEHGYSPKLPEMDTGFFALGAGVGAESLQHPRRRRCRVDGIITEDTGQRRGILHHSGHGTVRRRPSCRSLTHPAICSHWRSSIQTASALYCTGPCLRSRSARSTWRPSPVTRSTTPAPSSRRAARARGRSACAVLRPAKRGFLPGARLESRLVTTLVTAAGRR